MLCVDRNNPENLTDEEVLRNRSTSQRKEPQRLAYFHGLMTAGQAVRVLRQKPPGSFFLRSKPDGFWLSFKKVEDSRIDHTRINCNENSVDGEDVNYFSVKELPGERFTSIRRLVEVLTTRGIMTSAINRRLPQAPSRASAASERAESLSVTTETQNIPTLGGHEANRLLRHKPEKVNILCQVIIFTTIF